MTLPDWVPEGLDITVPNAARVYDYALGGFHNFAVDREFKEQAELAWPGLTLVAYANRSYLGRAVQWLIDAGVRQFLDIGAGIPTRGAVHEIAQTAVPDARVVYVDIDPVAVSHGRAILAGNPLATTVQGDLRRPTAIFDNPEVREVLDFSQPIGVLMIAVLHFISDDDGPASVVGQVADALVPGSYLALSHATMTPEIAEQQERVRKLYTRTPTSVQYRSPEQVADMLSGLEIIPPGIVPATDWHPSPEEADDLPQPSVLAAVARKR